MDTFTNQLSDPLRAEVKLRLNIDLIVKVVPFIMMAGLTVWTGAHVQRSGHERHTSNCGVPTLPNVSTRVGTSFLSPLV